MKNVFDLKCGSISCYFWICSCTFLFIVFFHFISWLRNIAWHEPMWVKARALTALTVFVFNEIPHLPERVMENYWEARQTEDLVESELVQGELEQQNLPKCVSRPKEHGFLEYKGRQRSFTPTAQGVVQLIYHSRCSSSMKQFLFI